MGGMKRAVRHRLAPGVAQRASLVPGLAESLRLLSLSGTELEGAIEEALERNVMLEREDPPEDPALPQAGDGADAGLHLGQAPIEETQSEQPDLRVHLMGQLSLEHFAGRDRAIAEAVIDALEENGYLREPEEALMAALSELEPAARKAELDMVIHRVQRLDPSGIAARDGAECLRLQLGDYPPDTPGLECARRLLTEHFEELGRARRDALARRAGVPAKELDAALALIRLLDPHPGYRFSSARTQYLVPELIASHDVDGWHVNLNAAVTPRVRVNKFYSACLPRRRGPGDDGALHDQARDARALVASLANRRTTLLRVGRALARHQSAFLDSGPTKLVPLAMHTVAAELELHESTISRAVQGKSMATPRGTIPLRHFFAASVSNESSAARSSRAIKAHLEALIRAENSGEPLSDAALVAALEARGTHVARRTVAKYREALGFASTRERRRRGRP